LKVLQFNSTKLLSAVYVKLWKR